MDNQTRNFPIPRVEAERYPLFQELVTESSIEPPEGVPEELVQVLATSSPLLITPELGYSVLSKAAQLSTLEPLYSLVEILSPGEEDEMHPVVQQFLGPFAQEARSRLTTFAGQIDFKPKTPDPVLEGYILRSGTLLVPVKNGFFRFDYSVSPDGKRATFERLHDLSISDKSIAVRHVYDAGSLSSVVMAFAKVPHLPVMETILPVFAYTHLVNPRK